LAVDLHFYFETANPTTLEVVREVIRGLMHARTAIQRGEYSRNFSGDHNNNNNNNNNSMNDQSGGIQNDQSHNGSLPNNNKSTNSKSPAAIPVYQRLYNSSVGANNNNSLRNASNNFSNVVKLDSNNNNNEIETLIALLQQQQQQQHQHQSISPKNRVDHERVLQGLLNRNISPPQKSQIGNSATATTTAGTSSFSPQPPPATSTSPNNNQQQQQFHGRRSKNFFDHISPTTTNETVPHETNVSYGRRQNNQQSNLLPSASTNRSPALGLPTFSPVPSANASINPNPNNNNNNNKNNNNQSTNHMNSTTGNGIFTASNLINLAHNSSGAGNVTTTTTANQSQIQTARSTNLNRVFGIVGNRSSTTARSNMNQNNNNSARKNDDELFRRALSGV
jgi:hypothetical protein